MACNGENPNAISWRDRLVPARLTGAEWKQYKRPTAPRTHCDDAEVDRRDEALDLLSVADGPCLETALGAIKRLAKDDLAAAYLTRFDRSHDPVDLLRALETAEGFNRALALEWLCLTKEAIQAWNEVAQERSDWSKEARDHLRHLQQLPDPVRQWNSAAALDRATERRDTAVLNQIVRAFPTDAARHFEQLILRDHQGARLLASALSAIGEHYPQAVLDAMDRTKNRAALERGLSALQDKEYRRAALFLERAGNPLALAARYNVVVAEQLLPALEATLPHLKPAYRELSSRFHILRAYILEGDGRYLDAHADYEHALELAQNDPTVKATTLERRGANLATIADAESAFRDAYAALSLLDRVADLNTRHHAYGVAGLAASRFGQHRVALYFQNAAVEELQRAVINASGDRETSTMAKHHLSIALRRRAEIHLELGQHDGAEGDLAEAADLAEAVEDTASRDLLRMRILEVRAQLLLKDRPAAAVAVLSDVIGKAKAEHSTYRAILRFQRATARRAAHDPSAAEDIAAALRILRGEVRHALANDPKAASEPLWTPYFSRFRDRYDELIESRIAAGDTDDAFVHTELARAFEPMQILLQSGSVPPGYRPIETVSDLTQARASLPEDTVILEFLVLAQRTYTWVVTREGIVVVSQRATRKQIEGWVRDAVAGIEGGQSDPFDRALRAVYTELFREPLASVDKSKTRIVIVPDKPMQGLPFNALRGTRDEKYLIERGSVAVAGSTSLYLYALARDRQLSGNRNPSALLIGDPAFDSSRLAERLPFAMEEVKELSRDYYTNAEVLTGRDATVQRFLSAAKTATIIHFAGHALANPQDPWQSRLLFAPVQGRESGELTAQTLMQQLPRLERTRLVVLGACSTAGGGSVGPQGLAPLVRPLIAAHVPAVVGTLWDVKDASAKELLVSFHCHYRHGDDVAVAQRQAQLERLRNHEPAMKWAAFQVAGYAASPYPRPIALEDPNLEHLCTQNSLQRPDGLHSQ
jgi:CHAT domain-containing protein